MKKKIRDPRLLPCPFCGGPAEIEAWHGGQPTKKMVSCVADDCAVAPCVTGENLGEAFANWNRRAT